MIIILLFVILLLLGVLSYVLLQQRNSSPMQELSQQLKQTTQLVVQQLNQQRESGERSSSLMHSRIDQATRVVSDVQTKLGQLEEANRRIFDIGTDISKLQQILQSPKLRGTMGEVWLQELIRQILPSEHFALQYAFKSGEICDAIIKLRDGLILPVDSKFSLENFIKMLECTDEQRPGYRKLFASDTKKRIDEISRKYILPAEGTLEFAFMYVPAENVYYQAFIQSEDELNLLAYAFSKKIIPVSPSSFYAYLQVILFGLKGLEIEKSAKEIQKNVAGLQGSFTQMREAYDKVGVHLRHAQSSFDLGDKRLGSIEYKLGNLAESEQHLLDVE